MYLNNRKQRLFLFINANRGFFKTDVPNNLYERFYFFLVYTSINGIVSDIYSISYDSLQMIHYHMSILMISKTWTCCQLWYKPTILYIRFLLPLYCYSWLIYLNRNCQKLFCLNIARVFLLFVLYHWFLKVKHFK